MALLFLFISVEAVDYEDKGVTEMMTPGGKQNMNTINESVLYSMVLSSKLPSAKKFKRWMTCGKQ